MNLEKILNRTFGFTSFRPGQKEIISFLLDCKDTIGVLPTGTGKTLCYQFVGNLLEGHVIIVSPLLSLMQDQVEQMKAKGEKKVIAINSFLTASQKSKVFQSLKNYKYIFISPEMLKLDFVIQKLQELELSLFVVDEAHCISQWGYDFRTDYLKLGEIRKKLKAPLTLALTATATSEVLDDIAHILGIEQAERFESSVDRPNIAIKVEKYEDIKEKQKALISHLQKLPGPGIIYFSSKKLAEQTVDLLKNKGITNIMAYHGGMSHEDRILIQQQFINGQIDYICATSAFGMGINKDDVRFVIHFHLPLQLESYLQELGRAGRDGEQSIAILLYSKGDENLALQLAEGELPSHEQLDWLLNELSDENGTDSFITRLTDELRLRGAFTEIQWRITYEYILTHVKKNQNIYLTVNSLKAFVKDRKNIKIKKIFDLVRFIQASNCRRNMILSYFGESIPDIENSKCCDNCGLYMEEFHPNKKVEDVYDEQKFDWRWKLKLLLTKVDIKTIGEWDK